MSEEKKEYSNEMRGTIWVEKARKNEKSPVATGTVTISGVELRIAVWPKRKAAGGGKRDGDEFSPISVEYKQGATKFLAAFSPANVTVTGATVAVGATPTNSGVAPDSDLSDIPF